MALPEQIVIESFGELEQLLKQDIALTPFLEMSQVQIDRFAEVSLDRQWIHSEPERAKAESPFGGTISHGFLNLSMAGYFLMSAVKIRGVQYGLVTALNYVRFLSAVPVGACIRGRIRLMQCERLKDSNQAAWMVTVERKGGLIPACVAEIVVRYYG
jgi:acyl dehydratase